jgi:hypothetical protein
MHIRPDLFAEEVFTTFSCTSDVVSTIKYLTVGTKEESCDRDEDRA